MELIRLYKRERDQTFLPSSNPIPPKFLESKRKTILEFKNGKKEFRRRTSMLGLPEEIYDRYDRIVKSCKVCSTSMPSPPQARIAGLRASFFGDLIFVDHAEINCGMNSHLVLLVIDGATNLLWAMALTSLDAPETLSAFRLWIDKNNCMPKRNWRRSDLLHGSFHGLLSLPWYFTVSLRTKNSWPNRAETAVRLFKRAWVHMAKTLTEEGYVDRVTVRQAVKMSGQGIANLPSPAAWR